MTAKDSVVGQQQGVVQCPGRKNAKRSIKNLENKDGFPALVHAQLNRQQ